MRLELLMIARSSKPNDEIYACTECANVYLVHNPESEATGISGLGSCEVNYDLICLDQPNEHSKKSLTDILQRKDLTESDSTGKL